MSEARAVVVKELTLRIGRPRNVNPTLIWETTDAVVDALEAWLTTPEGRARLRELGFVDLDAELKSVQPEAWIEIVPFLKPEADRVWNADLTWPSDKGRLNRVGISVETVEEYGPTRTEAFLNAVAAAKGGE